MHYFQHAYNDKNSLLCKRDTSFEVLQSQYKDLEVTILDYYHFRCLTFSFVIR